MNVGKTDKVGDAFGGGSYAQSCTPNLLQIDTFYYASYLSEEASPRAKGDPTKPRQARVLKRFIPIYYFATTLLALEVEG